VNQGPEGLTPCSSVPHHITAFFIPHIVGGDPYKTGSLGAGLLVDPPARACFDPNAQRPEGPLGRSLELLGAPGGVRVWEPLPPMRGYATSAAVSLAGALAAAAALGRGLLAAAREAHRAEVEEKTGLGDVLAIWGGLGGVVVRLKPGAPGEGLVESLPVPPGLVVVTASRGETHTRSLLSSYGPREREAASAALRRIVRDASFEAFVEAVSSYVASVPSARPPRPGGAGVLVAYRKKNVSAYLVEADRVQDLYTQLSRDGFDVRVHRPWQGGAPVVEWINPLYAPPWS